MEIEKLATYLKSEFGVSPREAEVVYFVSKGWTNKEVAITLLVCEKTIKFHLTNIFKKMKMRTRGNLISFVAGDVMHRDLTVKETPAFA